MLLHVIILSRKRYIEHCNLLDIYSVFGSIDLRRCLIKVGNNKKLLESYIEIVLKHLIRQNFKGFVKETQAYFTCWDLKTNVPFSFKSDLNTFYTVSYA